jgi:hypothetical protein
MEVKILFLFCHPELVEGQNKKRLKQQQEQRLQIKTKRFAPKK